MFYNIKAEKLSRKSYKFKYRLLLISIGIAGVIIYLFAIKKTIAVIAEYGELTEKLEMADNAPAQIAEIEIRMKQMEHLLLTDDSVDFEELLLEHTSTFCQKNNVCLIEFPKTNTNKNENYILLTNRLVLEGNFKNILEFIDEAEQKATAGKIVSVHFKKTRNIRTKEIFLYAYIYFQNIQLTTNNETDI